MIGKQIRTSHQNLVPVKDRVPCHEMDHIKLTGGDEYGTQLRVQPINHQAHNAEQKENILFYYPANKAMKMCQKK